MRINLHAFRHFCGTKLYLQTVDIMYVQKKPGHRNIISTTVYENSMPNQEVETYATRIAASDDEKLKLINLGYEYSGLNTNEGQPIMRRRVIARAWTDEDKLKLLNLGFEYSGINTDDGHAIMKKKVWN